MNVVNSSATVNVAQAVGSMDRTVIVPSYDWTSFLAEHVGKCVGIKSFTISGFQRVTRVMSSSETSLIPQKLT